MRGSTPVGGPDFVRYGGHTSCVLVEPRDSAPIVIDLGTGIRNLGRQVDCSTPNDVTVLLTHLHWDHVQGIGFCAPLMTEGRNVSMFGPRQEDNRPLSEALDIFMRPPFFPVRHGELGADVTVHDIGAEQFEIDGVKITSGWLTHPGPTLGFRIEADGMVFAFCTDHGPGALTPGEIPVGLLELCDGADLLLHDAQHTWEEYQVRKSWGHSPVEYAVEVAAAAGVHRLGLFHFDPNHSDSQIDAHVAHAQALGAEAGLPEVFGTYEGLSVELSKELSCR